jgi:Protein of unknown function (DUF1566)
MHLSKWIAVAVSILVWTGSAAAATSAQKCRADKLKRTGKYVLCRMKADGKAVKTGQLADYTKCEAKFLDAFGSAEAKYGMECPTSGDAADIQDQATAAVNLLAQKLAGVRFVDNGDGTVTDTETGLMWEQKDDAGGIHDQDNLYTWSATGTGPDGTAFTTFLASLNGTTSDGTSMSGCFAGHCDWRLPTIVELQTILLEPYPCSAFPCIDPVLGPIAYPYFFWSSTGDGSNPAQAWDVRFSNGSIGPFDNTVGDEVRAVRGVP